MIDIPQSIKWLYDNTESLAIKDTIDVILSDSSKYRFDEPLTLKLINESIDKFSDDDHVIQHKHYMGVIENINNMGVGYSLKVLTTGHKSLCESLGIYEKLNFLGVQKNHDNKSDYLLIDELMNILKPFTSVNEINNIYKKLDENANGQDPYYMVQQCIESLYNDEHSYLYDKILFRLESSMHLPPAQCYAYLYREIVKVRDMHPALNLLYDQMHNKLDTWNPQLLGHSKGYMDIAMNAHGVTNHISLIRENINEKIIKIGNVFFDIKNGVKKINEIMLDNDFIENCNINDRIIWYDGKLLHEPSGISINETNDGLFINIDNESFKYTSSSKLSNDLFFNNIDVRYHKDIVFITENYHNFTVMENVFFAKDKYGNKTLHIIDKGDKIDILESVVDQDDIEYTDVTKKHFVDIFKYQQGFDLSEKLNLPLYDKKTKKFEQLSITKRLDGIVSQIQDVKESLQLINNADVELRSDPDIISQYGLLIDKLSKLELRKQELENI